MGGVMDCLSDKSGCELVFLASSFALTLSQGLSCDEINLLATFLTAVGDNLAIIGTQCAGSTEISENSKDNSQHSNLC